MDNSENDMMMVIMRMMVVIILIMRNLIAIRVMIVVISNHFITLYKYLNIVDVNIGIITHSCGW